jgi:hypothetical protein
MEFPSPTAGEPDSDTCRSGDGKNSNAMKSSACISSFALPPQDEGDLLAFPDEEDRDERRSRKRETIKPRDDGGSSR